MIAAQLTTRITDRVLAAVLFVLAFVSLHVVGPPPPLHADTARDLLMARACLEPGRCPSFGAAASFGHLIQGALWIHFLAVARWLHSPVRAAQLGCDVLHAAAVAAMFVLARRFFSVGLALIAAGCFLVESVWLVERPVLWNPTLLPLVMVAFYLFAVEFFARDRLLPLAAAAFCLGLTVELHVIAMLFLPALVVLATLRSRAPLSALCIAVAGSVAGYVVDSSDAARLNLAACTAMGWNAIAIAIVAAAALVMLALGWQRPRQWPVWVWLAALAAGYALPFLVLAKALGIVIAPRYLTPLMVPLALATTLPAFLIPRRARGVALALAGACLVTRAFGKPISAHDDALAGHPELTLPDVEIVAARLGQLGWAVSNWPGLEARGTYSLLPALGVFLPFAPNARGPGPIIDKHARALPSPPGWTVVTLDDNFVAALSTAPPFVHLDAARCCRDDGNDERCAPTQAPSYDPGRSVADQLTYPTVCVGPVAPKRSGPYRRRFIVPIQTSDDARREIVLADSGGGAERWHIDAVAGVPYSGALGGTTLIVGGGPAASGTLTLSRLFTTTFYSDRGWPPSLIERRVDSAR